MKPEEGRIFCEGEINLTASYQRKLFPKRFCHFRRSAESRLESPGFLYNHLIFSTQGEENVYRTKLRVQKHFPSLECHHLIIETCLIANSFCLKKFSSDLSSIHFSVLSSRQASGSNFSRLREMNFVNASNKGILSFPSFQI